MAKASATGLCATSLPRMLNSQAMESGSVRTTASSPSLRRAACSSAIFCSRRLARVLHRMRDHRVLRRGGRSRPQTRSTGLAASGLSLMPFGFRACAPSPRSSRRCAARDRSPRRRPPSDACRASSSRLAAASPAPRRVRVSTCARRLHRVAPVDEQRGGLCVPITARPAEPEKPVSQLSRSAEGGTYSPWCSSARGTSTASSPWRISNVRKALTRLVASAGEEDFSKLWNMRFCLSRPPSFGNRGMISKSDLRSPAG